MNQGKKPTIVEALQRGRSIKEIVQETGVCERYVHKVARQLKTNRNAETTRAVEVTKCDLKTVDLDSLIEIERLDSRKILREGVACLSEGQVARDETLRKDLGISGDKWRELGRAEEFSAFRAVLPSRRVVWGRAKTIAELKKLDGVT